MLASLHNSSQHMPADILQKLSLSSIRLTSTILPDLMYVLLSPISACCSLSHSFNDCAPSLTITFCHDLLDHTKEHLEAVQSQTKNCFGISIGEFDEDAWMDFQNSLEFGTMRLFRASDLDEAVELVSMIRQVLNCPERYANQDKYFEELLEQSVGPEAAQACCREILSDMAVPDDEIDIILEAFPTLQALFTASRQTYEETLPVSTETISKMIDAFETEDTEDAAAAGEDQEEDD